MDPRTTLATSAAVAATALLGGLASTGVRSTWYQRLDKPAFQPPGAVFGPVWTVLYADIAVTTSVALEGLEREDPAEVAAYQRALAANLVLNASWSWVFFRGHRLLPAVLVAGALATSSADLVRRTARVDRRAGVVLAPYAAWCTFATVLSTALWWRNR